MNEKVKRALDCIVQRFKTGDIPKAIAFSIFPASGIPSTNWSKLNKSIMYCSGTLDARGMKQWREAGRRIKKNSKAIYILVPHFRKTVDENTGQEKQDLVGFFPRPVFKVEDTTGAPLNYEALEPQNLPLINCANKWGISVKAIPGNYSFYGYYSPSYKEIGLATAEELTFFHELAHCSHEKLLGGLAKGQDPFQEIVAELAAQALCHLVGKSTNNTMGNSYHYIKGNAEKLNIDVITACLQVMNETEQVLTRILETSMDSEKIGRNGGNSA